MSVDNAALVRLLGSIKAGQESEFTGDDFAVLRTWMRSFGVSLPDSAQGFRVVPSSREGYFDWFVMDAGRNEVDIKVGPVDQESEPVPEPVTPKIPPPDKIASLLKESLDAHNEAKVLRTQGDRVKAKALLVHAAMKRVEAMDLDPDRTSPAWQSEQDKTPFGEDTHESLMAFYRKQGVL